MWSDARSLFSRARSIGSGIITHIAETLDGDPEEETNNFDGHSDGSELVSYKRMLIEAQMQHVELSKQSRILLAEKDAELIIYRQKLKETLGEGADECILRNSNDKLEHLKLQSEKNMIDQSMKDLEIKLKNSLEESNDARVKIERLAIIEPKYEQLNQDFRDSMRRLENSERQKNETIENLVTEYSNLAADSELRQIQDSKRIAEVTKENEILTTKLYALEHSITEIADRTVTSLIPISTPNSSSPSTLSNTTIFITSAIPIHY